MPPFNKLHFPQIIAHRGAPRYAPENTIASFHKAYQLGAKWVEFDVRLTRDKRAIIFHDDTLERLTEGEGKVSDFTYGELQKLHVQGESIPSFEEVLNFLAPLGMAINVEIKADDGVEKILTEKTIELLNLHWSDRDKLLLSSFSNECMRIARDLDDTMALGCVMHEYSDEQMKLAELLHCVSLHIFHENLNAELVKSIHDLGYKVLAYTVNDSDRAHALFDMGVDSIFSDYPDVLTKE